MKAVAIAIALIIAAASSAHAQSRLTLIGGYSIDRMMPPKGDGGVPITSVSDFVPGVGLTLGMSDRVGLTAEALYVHKGYSTVNTELYTTESGSRFVLDVKYLELPLLLTARYPFGKAEVVVLGGATVAVRQQCSATIYRVDSTQVGSNCTDSDSGKVVPATDVVLTAGFGFSLGRFTLTGRYELTGSDIHAFGQGLTLQHRTLILMLGVDLLKGKSR